MGYGFDLNPQVIFISSALLIIFIALTLIFPSQAELFFSNSLNFISKNAGWFLVLAANIFIIAGLLFAFGKFGDIKIGGSEAQPEFLKFGWFAMLLSAGMGIGLLF